MTPVGGGGARLKHWVATRPGGPEVFELVEEEVPAPGPGEVTVQVRAAGVNPADHKHVAVGDRPTSPGRWGMRWPGSSRRSARPPSSPPAAVRWVMRCWPSGSAAAGRRR